MKLTLLIKQAVRELVIFAGVLIVIGGVTYAMYSRKMTQEGELTSLKKEMGKMTNQIASSLKEIKAVIEALESYKNFAEKNKPTVSGLDKPASRIREARPIIEDLKDRYKFGALDVTFSNIETGDESTASEDYKVVKNNIEIIYTAVTDELVLSFIHDMLTQLPGYLQLSNFTIQRRVDIIPNLVQELAKQPQFPPLVEGTIVFSWKTLKGEPITVDVDSIKIEDDTSILEELPQ